jgi:hypothetical protein
MKCCIEIWSGGMINIPSYIMIVSGIQTVLWFILRNLRGCNVDITDGRY